MGKCMIASRATALLPFGIALVIPLIVQAPFVKGDFDRAPCSFNRGSGLCRPLLRGNGGGTSRQDPGFADHEDSLPDAPMLRGLSLTETQSDTVFAIVYAHMPPLGENVRAAPRAQADLQHLAPPGSYDEAKGKSVNSNARAPAVIPPLHEDATQRIAYF